MNYKERIAALTSFKSTLSGDITDELSGVSYDVDNWTDTCSSKTKFDSYMSNVQSTSATLAGARALFIQDVNALIASIQSKFDQEYNDHSGLITKTYSKDATENKTKKTEVLNSLQIDSSVKDKLRELI